MVLENDFTEQPVNSIVLIETGWTTEKDKSYSSFKDRWESLTTNTGEFTLILGVQVVSVYCYIEPITDYCICSEQSCYTYCTCL